MSGAAFRFVLLKFGSHYAMKLNVSIAGIFFPRLLSSNLFLLPRKQNFVVRFTLKKVFAEYLPPNSEKSNSFYNLVITPSRCSALLLANYKIIYSGEYVEKGKLLDVFQSDQYLKKTENESRQ